jgi:hypothetical protein
MLIATIAPVCHLLSYQMRPMAFHAQPDIVEEPAGKRQEPQTPILCFTLLIRCVTAADKSLLPSASPEGEEKTRVFIVLLF